MFARVCRVSRCSRPSSLCCFFMLVFFCFGEKILKKKKIDDNARSSLSNGLFFLFPEFVQMKPKNKRTIFIISTCSAIPHL